MADDLDAAGWHVNRNTEPLSIHLMLSPGHIPHVDQLVADIAAAAASTRARQAEGAGAESGAESRDRSVRYS